MPLVVRLLRDLGFGAVVGILDGNRREMADALRGEYDPYEFHVIPTAEVRTKGRRPAAEAVEGLADHGGRIRPE